MSEQGKQFMELVSRSHEQYENVKEVDIFLEVDGEMHKTTIEMFKVFSPVGIKNCVVEYLKNIKYSRDMDKEGFVGITQPYLMYLLIKHFTNVGEDMPNDFQEQLASLSTMLNTGALLQIVIHFDVEEIERVKEELEIALNTFEDNYQIFEEMKKYAEDQIENPEILE